MVNIENSHFRLKEQAGLFMHNRYIHYVWINSLAKAVKCRLEYFQLLAVCELGEQAGERSCPSKPLPPQAIPVLLLGSVASKYFVVILAVAVRRGRV